MITVRESGLCAHVGKNMRYISKNEIDTAICSIIGTKTSGFMNKLFE